MDRKVLKPPLTEETVRSLKAGDFVTIQGIIYTARDAAHKRMVRAIANGEPLPFDPAGQVIYYTGPCPGFGDHPIGSCGPTTSGRMDGYTVDLLRLGLKGMIGKGERSAEVREAMQKYRAVYLATVGGAGAYLSRRVVKAEIVAYPDLGPEAVMKLEVVDFPCIVATDAQGGNLYREFNKGDK
ncbi:MAG: FumA C-terminus/TtdB family hydratase beta subunit [Syntrophomonadales bacterium]